MTDHSRTLVTSALPYANGAIHFGHLAGAYLPADMYVRFLRLMGKDVLFICGSDEHGVSILISASKEKVTPKDIIDRYHELNRAAFEGMGISFDFYARTSSPVHHATAQEWFLDFHEKGILTQKTEKQLFDATAGMFLPDRFVMGVCPHCGYDRAYGDQCENCSTYYQQTELKNPRSLISGETPVIKDAVHWYFPLGRYQPELERYVNSHRADWKDNVLQQVQSWLTAGLSDRPISRDMTWGVPIPLPGAEGKVLYVWFEAVLGYISSTKEWAAKAGKPDAWKNYWCSSGTRYIAFIGKDNIVFHCLMFPAMLMAKEGYVLPDNVPANEFLNLEGQKFSKSRNWSIEIQDFLASFPADPLRYTLAMNLPESRDSDFYWKDFQARNNNELGAIFGNFVHRTLHFAHKNFGGVVPEPSSPEPEDEAFLKEFAEAGKRIADCYERFRFRDGVNETMNLTRTCNKYFNDREPWKTLTGDPVRCANTIGFSIRAIYTLAVYFEPLLPFTAERIRRMLNLPTDVPWTWNSAGNPPSLAGIRLNPMEILFDKIEDDRIAAEIGKLGRDTPSATAGTLPDLAPIKDQITIDSFGTVDLRVGKIVEAERVPKSEKLLKLKVDIGHEVRQIVAGIGKAYAPESIRGMNVIVVVNLKYAKLFGIESQGMVLAATNHEGLPVLLQPMTDLAPGSTVR